MTEVKTPAKRKAPAKKPAAKSRVSKTSARTLVAKERAFEAARMKVSGETLEAIGKALKVSRQAVHQMLTKYYEQIDAETLANLTVERQLDLERLDALIATFWLFAVDQKKPDHKSAELVMKAMDKRREILGYGAATRTEITGAGGAPIAATSVFMLPLTTEDAAAWSAGALLAAEAEDEKARVLLEAEFGSDDDEE